MSKRKNTNSGSSSTTQTTKKPKNKGILKFSSVKFKETSKIGEGHIIYDDKKIFVGQMIQLQDGKTSPAKGIMVNDRCIEWYKKGQSFKKAFFLGDGALFLGELKTNGNDSEGKGLKITHNNDIYVGEWKKSKIIDGFSNVYHNSGYMYCGTLKNCKRHGKGTARWPNRDVYIGQWENDKRHGEGKQIYAIGDVYIGKWKNDKRHGKGNMMYNSGSVFNGEWKNGNRHGDGKMIYSNGDVYIGQWKHEQKAFMRHGQGKIIYANGEEYDGEWKNDKRLDTKV